MFLNLNQNSKNEKIFTILFFLIYLVSGLYLVKDYGVSSDEYSSRIKGFVTLNYIGEKILPDLNSKIKGDKNITKLEDYKEKIYGVVFEAPVSLLEILLKINDKKDQFLLRHYFVFLTFFVSTIFFFKSLSLRFNNFYVSLIGTCLLIFSPRIFANSFYNNKDLVFLSLIIISSYYSLIFINKPNKLNAIKFSLFSALSIDVRVLGLIVPIIVYPINFLKSLLNKEIKHYLKVNLISIFFLVVFIIIFWPYLWESPFNNFVFAFKEMSKFEITTYNLFFGKFIEASNVPWYFIPTWILITTPILYLILFFAGLILSLKMIFMNRFKINNDKMLIDIYFFGLFIGPLLAIILFNSTLYNGWRQLYFIYPCLIYFSSLSLDFIFKLRSKKIVKIIYLIITINIFLILFWMVRNHPHQYVYFNSLIGKDNLSKKFDIDYWGLSYKENLKYILNTDSRKTIKIINTSHNKLFYTLFSLDKKSRERFIVVNDIRNADYVMTNFYLGDKISEKKILENFSIIKEIIIDKYSINTVYKKINN